MPLNTLMGKRELQMKRKNQEWFKIEEIDCKTFAISEYGHWEQTHAYLLMGKKSAALIDTGTGIGNIEQKVKQLTNLPVIVVTTHCHWDHIGGHEYFDTISIHSGDKEWLENGLPIPLETIKINLMKEPFLWNPPPDFSLEEYRVYRGKPTTILEDGNEIDLGNRKLKIIHTPGHSPGHICVYEEEKWYLATGDILYEGTVYANYPSTDPIALYKSIQRLAGLPKVEKLLPGHNRLNIPTAYLEKFRILCKKIALEGRLKHGTGLHQAEGVALLL
jgi:glyoxylase-like metal-dependent hydrolase (beta-lactamase superfamily II)